MLTQFERRPLLVALVALSIGIVCRWDLAILLLLIPLFALARSVRSWSVVALFLVVGYAISPEPAPMLMMPRFEMGNAKVESEGYNVQTFSVCTATTGGLRITLIAPLGSHLHGGEIIKGPFRIRPISEEREQRDLEEGIQGTAKIDRVVVVSEPATIFKFADAVEDDYRRFADENTPAEIAPWIQGLWLKSGIRAETDSSPAIAARYSLIASSGLHVYVLWGVIMVLMARLGGLDRRIQLVALVFVLVFYCLLMGLHESTIRASLTCIFLSVAYIFRREPDLISVTSIFGILFLFFFPRSVTTLGFQLSVLVPFAFGFFLPGLKISLKDESRNPIAIRFRQLASINLILLLSVTPLLAFFYEKVGIGDVAGFLVFELVSPLLLTCSLVGYFLHFANSSIASGLMQVLVTPLVNGMVVVAGWVSTNLSSFPIPAFSANWLFLYFSLWILLWRQRELPA